MKQIIDANSERLDVTTAVGKSVDETGAGDRYVVACIVQRQESYSNFAVQFCVNAYSTPAPTSQPTLVLLLETATEAPVPTLVTAKLPAPTQPPPALP